MEPRSLVAYGLIALLLIGLIFTIATLWRRAHISRSIMEGRDWKHGSKGWPWYH